MTTTTIDDRSASGLAHFPIAFFAMVMGLAGVTIAWQKTRLVLGLGVPVSAVLAWVTAAVFVVLLGFYGTKLARHPESVRAEFGHPVKLSFFPTISISLILLSVVALHVAPPLARGLWLAGAAAHLVLTLTVLHIWFTHRHFEVHHINPAWFIPVVGNILAPIAGVELGYTEPSWFFFSIGLVFWPVLLTIIVYRVLFHDPLPERLLPTLFIMIAPPAAGFIAYVKLAGDIDAFARVLYYIALFLTLFLFTQTARLARIGFFLSWWAYSFPLAAMTIATWVMYERTQTMAFQWLAMGLLAILNAVALMLVIRTVGAIMRREVCVPD